MVPGSLSTPILVRRSRAYAALGSAALACAMIALNASPSCIGELQRMDELAIG
jgi:hypothetical protein